MGLDMYLSKKTYVKNWEFQAPGERHTIIVLKGGEPRPDVKSERISYVVEEVGYWRKANAIHHWFVENVQNGVDDCGTYYVGREKLRALLADVKAVLNAPARAAEVLPTQTGFFFGSTDYGEYYVADLKHTEEMLEGILAEPKGDGHYEYHSSW